MNDSILRCVGKACRESPHDPSIFFGREPILGIPKHIFWNFVIILIVALIFWWLVRGSQKSETALELLKKRYVSGEIGRETYLSMKKDISEE